MEKYFRQKLYGLKGDK